MSKKKSDTEKKSKEPKASKPVKKAAGKSEKSKKDKPAKAVAPAVPAVPAEPVPAVEAAKPAVAEAPKSKLVLPKKPAAVKRAAIVISADDISLRAYFIAERRSKMGWPGDETSDWVEAERQLLAEAAKKAR